jgi:formylglycine-generating enzyme required for sulfatase activity
MSQTSDDTPRSAFLSFTSLDREAARTVARGLKAAGVDVWWDEGGIGWGDDWQGEIEQALSRCGNYVILLGQGGVRRWVKPELGIALKRYVDDGLPILPLLLHGVTAESMPPFLSLFQARSLPPDLGAYDFKGLARELAATAQPSAPLAEGLCPFPGLLPFEEEAAPFFLGRQADTLAVLQRLGPGLDGVHRRWLQVEGPSGVGKSSLVRAGLIPAVRDGWLEEQSGGEWTVLILRPGARPLQALAATLERTFRGRAETERFDNLRDMGRTDRDDLAYLVRVAMPAPQRLLLVIDQLEEIFTLTDEEAARNRFDALLAAALADGDCPLYLVTTVRSDFLLHIGELPRLQTLLNERAGRYDLRPLGIAGLTEIVRIPALRAGLGWSEPSLPERIVEDAIEQRAPLPLVANLLRLLWDRSQERGDRVLSADDYRDLRGVAGALGEGADRLLNGLHDLGKDRARDLLLALIQPGRESQDTRRSLPLDQALEAAGGGAEAQRVLDRLSGLRSPEVDDLGPRLVAVSESGSGEPNAYQVDLAHEALLRCDHQGKPYWETLYKWARDNRAMLESRALLEALAEQWRKQGCPRLSGLASGRQLKAFARVKGARDPAPAYLRASRLRRRLMNGAWAVGLALVFVGIHGWWLAATGLSFAQEVLWIRALAHSIEQPEMVPIRPDSFKMGCVSGIDCSPGESAPVHGVLIEAFAMSRTEVTFDQYDQFALATGRDLPDDQGWGRGDRPAINVSWREAAAYAEWLSGRMTGKPYRLPTEAEWEYAARAGSNGLYWWCPLARPDCDMGPDRANCQGCESTKGLEGIGERTLPVGSFPANQWGLRDTAGNVWEWVQDCWHDDYEGAPDDGRAWMEENGGDCGRRVIRGGGWVDPPRVLRSASRYGAFVGVRGSGRIGFRLAHDL